MDLENLVTPIPMDPMNMDTPMNTWSTLVTFATPYLAVVFVDTLAGKFSERDLPDYSSRNFEERGFTIGIGG